MRKILLSLVFAVLAITPGFNQEISPFIAGQNAWMPTGYGGAFYDGKLDKLWPLVKQSKVQMIRVGGNGVEFNLPTGDEYLKLIDSIRNIGAEPMVQVPNGRGKYTAAQAAAIVDYVNIVHGRNIKYWIIGNEPNLSSTAHPVTVDPAGVGAYIKEWSTAMKVVDPSILTVGPEVSFYDPAYMNALVGGAHDITGKDVNGRYYIDIISFHTYPFNGTQTREQVLTGTQSLIANVDNLIQLMNNANTLHNRTGSDELTWALTEFNVVWRNPASNTVEGVGVHSFLNGQYWAEVFNVGMQRQAFSIMPWSVHESGGARTDLDLGYIDGSEESFKPRASYYHEMLIAENFKGNYLGATDNQTSITAFGSEFNDTTSVMLINKSQTDNFDFTIQLSDTEITNSAALKVNVLSDIDREFSDRIFNQSTVVLQFNAQGDLIRKIVYSLQHAIQTLPPSYLNPGESSKLVNFLTDKTVACVVQDQNAVTFTPSIHGSYSSLSWDFGEGAVPPTGSGEGPFVVTYSTTGAKNVSLSLEDTDTTIVVNKEGYINAISCIRSPYAVSVIPGVLKAVHFDNGGEGAAYHDIDNVNVGAIDNTEALRAGDGVDTDTIASSDIVGWTETGEWLKYTVAVQKSANYKVTARLASVTGGTIRITVNNTDKSGVISIPKTSSSLDYQNILLGNLALEAGSNVTIKIEIVKGGYNLDSFTFTETDLSGIVVNRIYNATSTIDGMSDAVELLVTKDHTDIRGLIIKDFETNLTSDAGGKYQFKDSDLWKDIRKGTTIVLRRIASGISGYTEDVDTTDHKIDLLFENTNYLANVAVPGHQFNLTNTEMVLLKSGSATGAADAVHAFVTNNGGGSPFFTSVTSHKLIASIILNTGAFLYPLSTEKTISDYNGTKAGNATDLNRNWGDGYGTNNITYVYALRGLLPPLPPPSIVVNRIYNGSNEPDGRLDAVELLVIKDRMDIRNLIVKDFETNNTTDNGGKYRFNDNSLWVNLRTGTSIILRKGAGPAGYVEDTNGSDFTIDILMSNSTYLTNLAPAVHFNITQIDMVLIKSGAMTGVDGAIHAFATRGGGVSTSFFAAVNSYKLVTPDGTDAGAGAFHYPLNPTKKLADLNGAQAAISKSTSLNWGFGFGQNNIDYITSLRTALTTLPPTIVVNRVYNGSNDGDGRHDAVELLVIKDHLDARNLIIKDFENNNGTDNGGKYRLNDISFWQDLRAGTTIVLRRLAGPAGYVQDTDPSDFTIDVLMENTNYVTNLSGGAIFNITQFDMVVVKTGAATGAEGTIHAFATKGGSNSPFFQSFNNYVLFTPDGTDAGGGSFHYPLNPTTTISDFEGVKGGISKSTAINWGVGFGQNNIDYIRGIRDAVIAPPTNLHASPVSVNKVYLTWLDNSVNENGFELTRSVDGVIYTSLGLLSANISSYTDSCLNYNTTYYYRVRATEGTVNSSWAASASATSGNLPAILLPDLVDECIVTAEPPVISDNCGGFITATTTDSLTYIEQGSFTKTWSFDFGNGNVITAQQNILVQDTTPPTAPVLPDVNSGCSVTLTAPITTDNCAGEVTGVTTSSVTYSQQGSFFVNWTFNDGNGNSTQAMQKIIVSDTIAPLAPVLADATGECSVTVSAPTTSDNCVGEVTGTTADPVSYTEQGTYFITWTFDDGNGNISTSIQKVIVEDDIAPVVVTQNISVIIVNGTASITASMVNNGSSDGCGIQSIEIDETNFECTDIGDHNITLTVTDVNGNVSTANAIVTVIGQVSPLSITASKPRNVFTGLDNNTLAIGYGAQSISLIASDDEAESYQWSPATGLSSHAVANTIFTPTSAGTYTFVLTVTNQFGCSSTASVTITVIDVRSGKNKISLCTASRKTIYVNKNAVAALLKCGASLGACGIEHSFDFPENTRLSTIVVFPNPAVTHSTATITLLTNEKRVSVELYDRNGNKVKNIYSGAMKASQRYDFNVELDNVRSGIYYVRVRTYKVVLNQKLMIIK
jgi:PKD repeat protein